ncbi:DUF4959 domain-containing protein [Parabacteroides sp. Marseille-P3160]|uniref:DUF4959 domain-containing protein n=1 Tax=Parabacteroides sp. Marseille-P3160 TaxID=1917887 RepID=UPI0013596A8D|nr:DUF4959 domain-containing protein [Parabacteroides sp. Marseille-P3160]
MKKHILFLMLVSLLAFSCKDDDDNKGFVDPVANVTTKPFIGSVILSWTDPISEDYYYTLISYKNAEGETVNKKVSRYSADSTGLTTATISGFTDVNEYSFSLTAVSFEGAKSSPVTVSGIPQNTNEAKDYVLGTVSVKPANMGATISWENISGVGVNLSLSYKDQNGVNQNLGVDASQTGSTMITGLLAKTNITVSAQNASGGDKSEIALAVEPKIDPDDLIDPSVEYLTFKASGTRLTISQPNVYNPLYEYKIITTANDPYIATNGLKKAKVGTMLVFRYKTTSEFTLELYWCNSGGGAAGGRSTRVTVPKNQSGDWETFTHDYSADMSTHKWAGSIGDFVRFDCGDSGGVTIEIRNINFRVAQ